MSANETLIKALRSTRGDYEEECRWHKFLLDATHGTGGFKGRYGATDISVLGWAAEAYSRFNVQRSLTPPGIPATHRETYLDQFPREEDPKFQKRIDVAHYTNYVGPISALIISYINKSPLNRDGESDAIKTWREDADGTGTSWNTLEAETILPRAGQLGWCPVLFDMPDTLLTSGDGDISKARARESGIKPRAIPLYPVNVLDWREDDACELTAVKLRTEHSVGDDLLQKPSREERYALWYRDRVVKYTISVDANGHESVSDPIEIQHTAGRVPIVVFKGEPTPGDSVRGKSIVADLSVEARTHFNLNSEIRDHQRGQVFAILGIPVKDMKTDISEVIAGNGSGIKIPCESNMPLHFVAPPESVSTSLSASRETSVKEMYRISRIEYEEPSAQATSGIARAYRFEQTNSRLRDLAAGFARSDQESLRLVGGMSNDSAAEKLTTTAPTDFSIEDLAADILNVAQVIDLGIGPTATNEIKRRLVRKVAPNLPRDVSATIDDEIDAATLQQEQNSAMDREMKRAALDPANAADQNQQVA